MFTLPGKLTDGFIAGGETGLSAIGSTAYK